MNIWEIAKKVGTGIIKNVVPGAGAVIDIVNEFLPDDKKLTDNSTGEHIETAINSLPADQRAALMQREFDVKIEEHKTLQTMLTADATSTHTTRPYIAKHSFHLLALVTLLIVVGWLYGVFKQDEAIVDAIVNGWPFVASIVGPFVGLLFAYFGILRKEGETKVGAATGNFKPSTISSIIGALRGK